MSTELANKLFTIMQDLRKTSFLKNREYELSKSEIMILHVLMHYEEDNQNATTADLSEKLHISKPAISQMLNSLEDKKYIERVINKSDRRLTCIVITELGNQVLKKEFDFIINKVSIILGKMGKEDSETFIELLSKYISIVKEMTEQKK